MSNHERWVVYPLLFLSLGLAFRNVVTQQQQEKFLETDLVRCKTLEVSDEKGERALLLRHEGNDVSLLEGRVEGGSFAPENLGLLRWLPRRLIPPQGNPSDKSKTPENESLKEESKPMKAAPENSPAAA